MSVVIDGWRIKEIEPLKYLRELIGKAPYANSPKIGKNTLLEYI